MIGCTLDNTLLELISTDGRKRVGRRRSHLHEWMRRDVTIIENVESTDNWRLSALSRRLASDDLRLVVQLRSESRVSDMH